MWRCGGLMVRALASGSNGLGSGSGKGHFVVFSLTVSSLPGCINV